MIDEQRELYDPEVENSEAIKLLRKRFDEKNKELMKTQEELNKIKTCCHLLPPPGSDIVLELLAELNSLKEEK